MININDTAAVILNWNGEEDTLACIQSILQADEPADIIIVDNGSNSDAIKKEIAQRFLFVSSGLKGGLGSYNHVVKCISSYRCEKTVIHLAELNENLGFAKGCNFGFVFANSIGYIYTLCLNNDTVIVKGLVEGLKSELNKEVFITFPQIRYFDSPNVIWNCGGCVTRYGRVKYHYAGQDPRVIPPNRCFRVGFVTGCCFLVRTAEFVSFGLFTERYFFGEEDVDLSLRAADSNKVIKCVADAVIYHRVSSSMQLMGDVKLRKRFVHYLNRIIHFRSRLSFVEFRIWVLAIYLKISLDFCVRDKVSPLAAFRFIRRLSRYSIALDVVDKNTFFEIMQSERFNLKDH